MKNVFLFLISLLCLYSCEDSSLKNEVSENQLVSHFENEIGKVIQNQNIITYDTDKLKKNWSKFIASNSSLTVEFNSISIEKDESGFYLYAVDEINGHRSRVNLIKENNSLYEKVGNDSDISAFGGTSITCSGCTSTGPGSARDCIPKKTYCTFCSKGTCTKTITSNENRQAVLVQDKPIEKEKITPSLD